MGKYRCYACTSSKEKKDMKIIGNNKTGICTYHFNQGKRLFQYESPCLTQVEQIHPIFHPTLTAHSHLSVEKRASIVAFHRIGLNKHIIMQHLACSMPTINHWINHYNKYCNLSDDEKSGMHE
jgi:hypothetical protein